MSTVYIHKGSIADAVDHISRTNKGKNCSREVFSFQDYWNDCLRGKIDDAKSSRPLI